MRGKSLCICLPISQLVRTCIVANVKEHLACFDKCQRLLAVGSFFEEKEIAVFHVSAADRFIVLSVEEDDHFSF